MDLTLELMKVTTLICHRHSAVKPCADGVASAILLRDALPQPTTVIFVSHGEEADRLAPRPGAIFCDVTPSAKRAPEWVAEGAIVFDHHKTAKDVVGMFGERGRFAEHPHQSGASLALLHAWVPMVGRGNPASQLTLQRAVLFVTLAAVRDTFVQDDPLWVEACEQAEALAFYDWDDFDAVEDPFGRDAERLARMMEIGRPLRKKRLERARHTWDTAIVGCSARGTEFAMVNTLDTSDVAELAGGRVLVGFHYRNQLGRDVIQYSLRSRHGGYDVGALCAAFGGGGHAPAGGFTLPMGDGDPLDRFLGIIDGYEAKVGL